MNLKTISSLLLLVSMILVLEPSIRTLINLEEAMSGYSWSIPKEILEARDGLIKQILGYVLLYISMFLGIWYLPQKEIQQEPKEIQRESKPKPEPRKTILEGHSVIQQVIVAVGFSLTYLVSFYNTAFGSVSLFESIANSILIASIVSVVLVIIVKYL